jgi:hypothetical protein
MVDAGRVDMISAKTIQLRSKGLVNIAEENEVFKLLRHLDPVLLTTKTEYPKNNA